MEFLNIKMMLLFLTAAVLPGFAQERQEKLEQAFAQSYEKEKNNDFEGASAELKKVYDAASYEINLRLGWLYYNSGNFEESVTFYSRAHALKPYSEEARYGLILPKAALGKWDEVVVLYNEILEIHPNNTLALFRLGMIYYNRKNFEKALPLFKKVVDLYPFDYDGLLMLAWTYYFTGNFNQARVLFNKVKLLNPGDDSANEGLQLMH